MAESFSEFLWHGAIKLLGHIPALNKYLVPACRFRCFFLYLSHTMGAGLRAAITGVSSNETERPWEHFISQGLISISQTSRPMGERERK